MPRKQTSKQLVKLGLNIQNLRKSKNLSQEDLSFITGLHRTFIGSLERGEYSISFTNLLKVISALKSNFSEMFDGIELEPLDINVQYEKIKKKMDRISNT